MKRKFLSLLLALVMCLGLVAPAVAATGQEAHLYAYTYDVSGQEEYAAEKLSVFIQAYGHDVDVSNFTLGQGILINDPNDLEKVLFPIWNEGNIVATLLVITVEDGVYQGHYSENYAAQFDALKTVATESYPLSLVVTDEHLYATVGDQWYDLNGVEGEYITQDPLPESALDVVDAAESLPYTVYPQTRIPTTYKKPFTIMYTQPANIGGYCYAYALGNVLYNVVIPLTQPNR